MKKSKIYTKTGDKGKTSLLGGKRVNKFHERVELYGQVDELNAYIGYLNSLLESSKNIEVSETLTHIQNCLFDMGSLFACESDLVIKKLQLSGVTEKSVVHLEKEIDKLDSALIPLKNFILPGGETSASIAHVCRTVTRRVERILNKFIESSNASKSNLELFINQGIFLNRLSDYFFVLSRWLNHQSKRQDIYWMRK